MEVILDGTQMPLGGAKQRATLAFLLMNPNRVVATSQLLRALWTEDMPKSARKILQNAIWGLRSLLTADGEDNGAVLVTQAPGYLLQLDPEKIDVHVFLRLAKQGRALLPTDPDEAARLLREALALWQGPALADLVETGIAWPELTSLQNARLDAMEDFFDAELARGRHQATIDQLELMVENEPLRERSCGQLMLALYRSGRQADALRVYGRVRAALVSELGLEPGRELQTLQSAILSHDPTLTRLSRSAAPVVVEQPATSIGRYTTEVGVVMIKAQPSDTLADHDLLDLVARVAREQVEHFGGTVAASIGSVSLALFDQHEAGGAGELRAVRAAAAINDRLVGAARHALTFQAAVTVGTVLVPDGSRPGDPASTVSRATLADCENLLTHVPIGEIWVSERARRSTASAVAYQRVTGTSLSAWRVLDADPFRHDRDATDSGDDRRKHELDLLGGLLGLVHVRDQPHLVTLVGAPGTGKSRLVDDFARLVAENQAVDLLRLPSPADPFGDGIRTVQARIIAAHCGIHPEDTPPAADAKLGEAVAQLAGTPGDMNYVMSALRPLIGLEKPDPGAEPRSREMWRRFLRQAELPNPMVILLDDLHRGSDELLDMVDDLTDCRRDLPLLVVAATRPNLLERRPEWGLGKHHATTITLNALPKTTARKPTGRTAACHSHHLHNSVRVPLPEAPMPHSA
ncbi:BTAD domain-containing putative transcriptional regulator [Saccharothrix sp. ALI-22-I]|uniref:BTAD domain-containing putative transcriptional regulator n=1 Tax=Saccharothrix sp. ALI-22-I TaxID=1933778 RepID=UPI001930EEDD|nr:BTAD domain-containing putative transcriptional regulator [Saccharothrix sp. ALI-22-I]